MQHVGSERLLCPIRPLRRSFCETVHSREPLRAGSLLDHSAEPSNQGILGRLIGLARLRATIWSLEVHNLLQKLIGPPRYTGSVVGRLYCELDGYYCPSPLSVVNTRFSGSFEPERYAPSE